MLPIAFAYTTLNTFSSFGYKYGPIITSDVIIDLRRIIPISDFEFWLTGQDVEVKSRLLSEYGHIFGSLQDFIEDMLVEDRALTFAFGCTSGRHRSVAVAEILAERLEFDPPYHRDLLKGLVPHG